MFQTNAVNGGMAGAGHASAQSASGANGHISISGQQGAGGASANAAGAAGGSMAQLIYPALHLQPLNDTFAPKQISLAPPGPQNKIKIGRQTNVKTIPQPSNGYFDSKVLSRAHAEVWSQDGKVYIMDVKSSNGTFINGARLSPEGQDSDTFELHTDDVVEFGIDIVGEDNKSIIHHKVACRVFLVMTAEEALGLRHDFAALYRGGIAGSTLNHHVVGPGAEGGLRRSKIVGNNGPGGYGGAMNGANGAMSFDHILHRLQAELQKSRDTAGELGSLNTAMNEIGDTMGGGIPPMQNPPYQHLVPSSSAANASEAAAAAAAAAREEEQRQQHASEVSVRAAELKALEEQVKETQQALQAHIDRLAAFEARVEDSEMVRGDLVVLREQVHKARFEAKEARSLYTSRQFVTSDRKAEVTEGAGGTGLDDGDFDDGASMMSVDTVVPQGADSRFGKGPVGVDEVDSVDSIGRLSNTDFDENDDDDDDDDDDGSSMRDVNLLQRLKDHVGPLAPPDGVPSVMDRSRPPLSDADLAAASNNVELSRRLEAMENQLEKALELGRTLADQHAEATENARKLEERIRNMEMEKPKLETPTPALETSSKLVKQELDEPSSDAALAAVAIGGEGVAAGGILGMLEAKWGKWRDAFEIDFAKERAGLSADREDLRRVVRMWDNLNQEVEDLVEGSQTDDGGLNGDEAHQDKVAAAPTQGSSSSAISTTSLVSTTSSKKKKKRRGANASSQSVSSPTTAAPVGVRRTTGAVGLGVSAELNRHLRALIYTDDYNLLVRDTHMESEGSTSASSSVSDTSRSAASKTTDDTSVGSASGSAGGGGTARLDDLPDGIRKRAMGSLISSSAVGRRKGRGGGSGRWTDLGMGGTAGDIGGGGGNAAGHGLDNAAASLPILGAAGVVVFGMTAWIMAGKGMNLGGGP